MRALMMVGTVLARGVTAPPVRLVASASHAAGQAICDPVMVAICVSGGDRRGNSRSIDVGADGERFHLELFGVLFVTVEFASGGATGFTEEDEIGSPRHVHRRQSGPGEPDPEQEGVAVIAHIVDDLVFRPESGKREDSGQSESRHDPDCECNRHEFAQAAHIGFHVERMMRTGMAD